MFLLGAFKCVRQIKLQPRVTVPVVVDCLNHRHEARTIRPRIQRGMKLPVQAAPSSHFLFFPQRLFVRLQYRFRLLKVVFRQVRYGEPQYLAFEQNANIEQLLDFFGRKRGHHAATMRHNRNQSLRFQLAHGFADGDAAHLKIGRDRVLPQLLSFLNLAPNNHFAQLIRDGGSERRPWYTVAGGLDRLALNLWIHTLIGSKRDDTTNRPKSSQKISYYLLTRMDFIPFSVRPGVCPLKEIQCVEGKGITPLDGFTALLQRQQASEPLGRCPTDAKDPARPYGRELP